MSKIETLRIHMWDKNDAVLGISESWLEDDTPYHRYKIDGYNYEGLNRGWGDDKTGGGVGIFIRNDVSYSTTNYSHLNVSSNDIEIQWVELVRNGKKNIVVANLYRPPDGNKILFIEALNSQIEKCNLRRKDLVIMGDFNFDFLNITKVSTKVMKVCINILGLKQLINEPTRSTEDTSTCLDWIVTNTTKNHIAFTRNWNVSDHLMVCIKLLGNYVTYEKVTFIGRTYKKYDSELFKACLRGADWGPWDDCNDVNERWEFILSLLSKYLNEMCPLKTFKVRRDRAPWISDHILEQIRDKDLALRKAKASKSPEDWRNASRLRNNIHKVVRKAKAKFIRDSLEENKKDSKKF